MRSWVPLLLGMLASLASASADPAKTFQELNSQLAKCIGRLPLHPGTEVTIAFAVNRNGSLRGKPSLAYLAAPKDPEALAADARAIAAAFDRCLPLDLNLAFGGMIMRRTLVFKIKAGSLETGT